VICDVEKAKSLNEINNRRKLIGYPNYHRIKIGDFRIGICINDDTVYFVRFLHRKDIYKVFP
jgi:mRNA interferase RelE/StbE